MGSINFKVTAILLLSYASQFSIVNCDGDHPHAHAHEATATTVTSDSSGGPTGTVTSVHSSSGDPGAGGGIANLIAGLSPDLIQSLAGNPQVQSALRASGIDPSAAAAAAAASSARSSGGSSLPVGGGYDYPSSPAGGIPGLGGLGGLGGLAGLGGLGGLPFFGPYKSLSYSGGFDIGYPYLVFKKIILVIGGGILILVILAILAKLSAKGGLLYNFGSSMSEALAGAASLDVGPVHKSVAGSAALGASAGLGPRPFISPQLNQRVQDSLDQQF